jgi:tetratricopeptide (TPR) repeat protein
VGLGGVGKTQIALECAFQLQTISPICSVFWIRATSTTSFENAYRDIGQYLEIPGLEDAKADVKKMVKTRLSQESVGKWLLIVDNADDFEMFYHNDGGDDQSSALSEYLPFSTLGAILFTTRDREAATQFAGPNVVVVDEMDDTESRELLRRNVHGKKLIDDDISMKMLLALLTNLPLAIMQAAAYLNTNGCTIADYLRIYQESNDNVIRLLSRDFQDSRRYLGMKNPVATTWLISFDQIQTRDPLAADYMAFISCIKEQDIPQGLLPPASEIKKKEAIGTLKAFGFVKDCVSGTSYDMHRLVYIAMQNWLRLKEQWRSWNEKTLDRMAYMFPWPRHENRAEWLIYLPHALYVIATIKQHFNGAINLPAGLLHNLASSLSQQGKYAEAEALNRQTLKLQETVLGKDHPDTLGSMNNLAISLRQQGKYGEAEALDQQTLKLQETVLGKDHPDTLRSMNNLAISLCQQGKYTEAEALDQQTLKLQETVLGKDHPDTLRSMNNLAISLCQQGKYTEAEALDRQTLKLRETVLGKDHPDTLGSMNNLASSLCQQGKYVEAEALDRQTLKLRETVLGKDHPDTLMSMNNLASSLRQQGKYTEAEALDRQTLKLRETVLGKDHPDTLMSMNNLAISLRQQGKYTEAEALNRQTLKLRETVLGKDHPDTLGSMNNLAESLRQQGKTQKKRRLEQEQETPRRSVHKKKKGL